MKETTLRKDGRENRQKIYTTILEKPQTFKQLIEAKIVSRATLSKYLKDLRETGLIKKTIEGNKIVYEEVK